MTKKLPKKAKAAVRAIAAEPASDDAIFGSVKRDRVPASERGSATLKGGAEMQPEPPLSLRGNPIVIFLGSTVLVGGLLLILAATAAAKHAQCLERLGAGELSACNILYMEAIR
ncbi:hypothetical protein [Sinorhizobium fredii]|uniref:hypothetical protein n=1 Tax=Rhizobium fredii TaxID=380 RepID=UPI0004AF921E|nr:hypothetical protein [Sinorhizobium fredii]ASY68862.1 hypothetical protein SF83666_c14410 [Sinorhizobium fredii CCBAU 83666]